jgi:hypothetical protein
VALELGTTNSTHVRDILVNGRDQVQPATPEWTSPQHAHVRGPPSSTASPNFGERLARLVHMNQPLSAIDRVDFRFFCSANIPFKCS